MAGVEASFPQRKGKEKGTPALFFLQMLQSLDRVLQVRLCLSPGFANVEIILQVWHVQREGALPSCKEKGLPGVGTVSQKQAQRACGGVGGTTT